MKQTKQLWFRAKRYGIGWWPSTWQGWVVTGVWSIIFCVTVIGAQIVYGDDPRIVFWSSLLGLAETGILILITYRTGEPLEFHWGKTKNTK